jgi:hypothetical protein
MVGVRKMHGRDETCIYIYILVGEPERKRLLGISRRRWENNTRLDLREIAWKIVN